MIRITTLQQIMMLETHPPSAASKPSAAFSNSDFSSHFHDDIRELEAVNYDEMSDGEAQEAFRRA